MPSNHYVHGQWNVICDSCGFKKKSGQVARRWDGLIVCRDTCWETDHPQKYIRVRETGLAVPFIRHEPADTFLDVCYIYNISAYSGLAGSGCMQSGITRYPFGFLQNLAITSPVNSSS